jgi:tRNA(Ile)-lysidine synthase
MSLDTDEDLSKQFEDSLSRLTGDLSAKSLLLAVSGGSDSMALMHLTAVWAKARGVKCSVVTVDHALRAESAIEAEFVKSAAQGLGLTHKTLRWNGAERSGNLQMNAREARYRLIASHRAEHDMVLTGHTLEDQAETFLLRLRRGSGVDGLSAIPEKRYVTAGEGGYWLIRPMLDLQRDRLRKFLKQRFIEWVDDPSNDDIRFDRVKMRHALAHLSDLGINAKNIAETSRHLQRARAALDQQTGLFAQEFCKTEHGDLLIERAEFQKQHSELRYRLISSALKWVSSNPYRPRFSTLTFALEGVLSGKTQSLHGCLVRVHKNEIRITREFNAVAKTKMDLEDGAIWDGRWKIHCANGQTLSGLFIAPLGPLGATWARHESGSMLPHRSLQCHPGVFNENGIFYAPSLIENKHVSVTFCAKPFVPDLGSY